MQFADAARQLDPEVYKRLRRSLELGKWPDGRVLTAEQKVIAMEAVIVYEQTNEIPPEQRVGHMDSSCKSKPDPTATSSGTRDTAPLRFVGDGGDK